MWQIIIHITCFVQYIICWEVSKLSVPGLKTALAPIWDYDTQSLYFINFVSTGEQSSIFRYSYLDGIFYSAYIEGITSPSFIIPTNKKCEKCKKCGDQLFAVGHNHDFLLIKWNGKSTKAKVVDSLFGVEQNNTLSRFHVGQVDSKGRFYGGTLENFCAGSSQYGFYRYTQGKRAIRLFGNLVSTSGIAFNDKARKMYHIDTCLFQITEFDYDPDTGNICNGKVAYAFKFESNAQLHAPLGLAIDTDGMLYCAIYSGAVWKIDPWTSTLIKVIKLPAPGAAGVAFGGTNFDILYVISDSTIINNVNMSIIQEVPDASSIYAITGLAHSHPHSARFKIK